MKAHFTVWSKGLNRLKFLSEKLCQSGIIQARKHKKTKDSSDKKSMTALVLTLEVVFPSNPYCKVDGMWHVTSRSLWHFIFFGFRPLVASWWYRVHYEQKKIIFNIIIEITWSKGQCETMLSILKMSFAHEQNIKWKAANCTGKVSDCFYLPYY